MPEKQQKWEIDRLPFEYRLKGPQQLYLYDDFRLHQALTRELLTQFQSWIPKDLRAATVQSSDLIEQTVQHGRVHFNAVKAVEDFLNITYSNTTQESRTEFEAISLYVFYSAWEQYLSSKNVLIVEDERKSDFFERVTLDLKKYIEKSNYVAKTDPIPNFLFTPQIAWYTKVCFDDFSYFINQTSAYDNQYKLVATVLIAGYTDDVLRPDALAGTHFTEALAPIYPAIQPLLPEAVRKRVEECFVHNGTIQPTKELKSFWHQVFVHHWVAQEQRVGNQYNAITPTDRHRLQRDPAVAVKFRPLDGTQSSRRAGSVDEVKLHEVEHQQAREQLRIEKNLSETRRNMRTAFERLLASYNLPDRVFSQSGDVSPNWEVMRGKSGALLRTFVQQSGKLLSGELSPEQKMSVIENTTIALKKSISEPFQGRQITTEVLFGPKFNNLSQLEQCMIILYGVLSLGLRISDQLTGAAVQILSMGVQPLLDLPQFVVRQKSTSKTPSPQFLQLVDFDAQKYESEARFMQDKAEQLRVVESGPDLQSNQWKNTLEYAQLLDLIRQVGNIEKSNRQFFMFEVLLMKCVGISLIIAAIGGLANVDAVANFSAGLAIAMALFSSAAIFRLLRVRARNRSIQGFENSLRAHGIKYQVENYSDLLDEWKKVVSKNRDAFPRSSDYVLPIVMTLVFVFIYAKYSIRNEAFSFDIPAIRISERNSLLSKLLGEYAERASVEIPDQKDVEAVRNTPVRSIGQAYQLPVGASAVPGSLVGYRIDEMLTGQENNRTLEEFGLWDNSTAVQEISADTYLSTEPTELVYTIGPARYVYPLQGYEITKVFYEGGDAPLIGSAGTVYFPGKLPDEVLIVSVPSPLPEATQGALGYPGLFESETSLRNWDVQRMEALTLNSQLSDDLGLQHIHQRAIQRIDALYSQYQDDLHSEQARQEYDVLLSKLASELKQYLTESRTYSLQNENPDLNGQSPTLVGIAQSYPAGFYCLVANKGFTEFFESLGVSTMLLPGENVFLGTEDELLVRFGHVKTAIILTSGRALLIDATPVKPNPSEDLSFMSEAVVSPDRSVLADAQWLAGVVAAFTAGRLMIRGAKRIHRKYKVISRNSDSIAIEWQLQQALPQGSSRRMAVLSAMQQLLLLSIDYEHREMASNSEQLTSDMLHLAFEAESRPKSTEVISLVEQSFLGTIQKLMRSKKSDSSSPGLVEQIDLLTEQNRKNIRVTLASVLEELPRFSQKLRQEQQVKFAELTQEITRLEDIQINHISGLEASLIGRIQQADLSNPMNLWDEVRLSNEYVITDRSLLIARKELSDLQQTILAGPELVKSLERCLKLLLKMSK